MSDRIVVVGSANMDLVVNVDRHPAPGETLIGTDYARHPGGKGANQAVAAGKLGGHVAFVGCVGRDEFGSLLADSLRAAGVGVTGLQSVDRPSGVAFVQVDSHGQNSIVVSPGANSALRSEAAERSLSRGCAVLCLQLEVPLDTVLAAAEAAHGAGAIVLLNLAPAVRLSARQLMHVTHLLVNEHEAALLLEVAPRQVVDDPEGAARRLASLAPNVVVTLGELGVAWACRSDAATSVAATGRLPAFPVEVVDTTAAGDAFAGALATRLAMAHGGGVSSAGSDDLHEAVRYASAAAALATTRPGAQPSLPTAAEVEALLGRPVE